MDKKILVPKNEDFLAGAGGLGLVATTQSRIFDCGFATRLRSSAALTVHRTVIHYRSPSSPPQIVSQQKEKAHEKRGLYLFGRGGRTRTRDPRFWSGSEVSQSLEIARFFARFNALFKQNHVS